MKEKTRKIFIMIVMAALIVSLMAASFAALTYGRYAGGRRDENSPYEDYIDFVGATAYEVKTPEQFVNAINSGYSYIKIAADAEEPFVINNNVADVYTNLVLDVNGHVVVRNSRNPLLDVRRSISVVLVYDSSTDADGGFYNPVGSALQTSGGTLTVGEGVYESGPKIASVSSVTAENITDVFVRDGERDLATSYERASSAAHLPKLTKDVYLENNVTEGYLRNDTYLLYTVEKNGYVDGGQLYVNAKETSSGETTTITADKFSPICNVASCDFYYYYPVDVAGTAKSPQTYAVVYGYNDVKTLAEDCTDTSTDLSKKGLVWPYAAIRSVEDEDTQEGGVTHARGGVFKTHFGEENTYCIYSAGGTMTVGTSGSDGGPTFDAVGSGVCIAMTGASDNVSEGGSLTISGGTFSSRLGNTIEMEGGNMTVTAGSFTKDATKDATGAPNSSTNNGSAIDITGGTLNMTGTEANDVKSVSFDIKGNYVNGIKMEKEESATADPDTIKNAAFSFNKESGQGSGGTSVAAIQVLNGSLNVSDSTFDFNQGYAGTAYTNNGIYVQGGSVNATNCAFSLSPNGSVTGSAAIASAGGNVTAEGCNFVVNGYSNYGVFSSGGEITATDCDFTMTQAGPSNGRGDNFGIYSMRPEGATKGGTATAEGCTINITGTYSAGVLSMDGTLNLGASQTKETSITVSFEGNGLSSSGVSSEGGEINLTGNTTITSAGLGITARGEINVTGGTSTVKTERGTGIYVQNGTLTVEKGATVDVDSKIVDACSWVVPPEHTGDESLQTNKYNGVFVNGGSLVSEGELNVTFTGVQNDAYGSGANSNLNANTAYRDFQIKSYAVRVEAGTNTTVSTEVTIAGGTISNSVGGGVYVGGGTVTLGVENGKGPTVQTTGTSVEAEGRDPFSYGGNWVYKLPQTGGPAVKVAGGESTTIYGGEYRSQQGDGIVTTGGNCTIYNGTFYGNDSYGMQAGPGASYSFKVYGGTVKVENGTFGAQDQDANGGGAFVAGTAQETATAQINGGSFLSGGQAAFSILDNATVTFGENNAANITVSGYAAGLVLEGYNGIGSPEITINGGNFSSTSTDETESSAIWSGNPNFKLTINGGELNGKAKDGIFITNRSWNNEDAAFTGTLEITGGKFIGSAHGVNFNRSISKGTVSISGSPALTGTNGSGINFGKTIEEDNVHITGGQYIGAQRAFGGQGTCQIFNGADGTVAYLYNGNNNTSIGYNGNMTNNIADIPYSNITVRTQ